MSPARPTRSDWLVAGVTTLAQLLAPTTGAHDATPTWAATLGTVAVLGQGAALAWRRSRPVAVSLVVLGAYAGYVALVDLTAPIALWVAVWSLTAGRARREGTTRVALVAAAGGCLVVGAGQLAYEGSAGALLAFATAVITLAGVLVGAETDRVAAMRERGATDERLRIARELHDLVGHGLSAVAVQSSAARLALDAGDTAAARRALAATESTSRGALRDMRHLLGVLQPLPGDPADRSPGLRDLDGLVANLHAGGVAVTLEIADDAHATPHDVQLCAYQVVREGLTNAVRHSPGARTCVEVDRDETGLVVRVTSRGGDHPLDGTGATTGGTGLAGVRARVQALGGDLAAGPTDDTPGAGWELRAVLPARRRGGRG